MLSEAELPAGPPATPRDISFLADPIVDQLLRAVVTLTMELSVTRDRLRSIEHVLSEGARDIAAEIEQVSLSPAEDAERRADRERLVGSILRPLIAAARPD